MIPRVGEPIDRTQRHRLRPGAYVILPRGDEVLLTIQYAEEPDIQLPGGGVDPGESPIPALHREVFEETGWHISAPRRLGAFRRFVFMPEYDLWAEKLCTIFVARPVRRISEPADDEHIPVWASFSAGIQILGNDGDRAFLKSYVAARSGR